MADHPLDTLTSLGVRRRGVYRQIFMVGIVSLSILSPGMGIGYPAVSLEKLQDKTESFHINAKEAAWFASVNVIFSPVGSLLGACVLDVIGRKWTVFLINVLSVCSWALVRFSEYDDRTRTYTQIMVGRVIVGIATGLCSAPVGVYSAEICHPTIRGRLILGSSLATAIGIFLIYTMGFLLRDEWRLIAMLAGFISMIALIAGLKIPESPIWLQSRERVEEAKIAFKFFQGIKVSDTSPNEDFEREYKKMQLTVALDQGDHHQSFFEAVLEPDVYKPLFIMIGFFCCLQISGLYIMIVYAVQIAKDAGVNRDRYLCAMMLGFVRIPATFAVGLVLDRWGRRPAALFSAFGMTACMLLLASIARNKAAYDLQLPVILLCLYIWFSTFGLLTLPFAMIGEMFPQRVRGTAASLTIAVNCVMSFSCLYMYPLALHGMKREYLFLIFGATSLLSALYIYLFLPETKGKSLFEISQSFKKNRL